MAAPPIPRIRGRALQRLRQALFAKHPWCVTCLEEGRQVRSTIRDHVIPLSEGGADDETNTIAVCLDCNDRRTAEESRRGVRPRTAMTDRFRMQATPRTVRGQWSVRPKKRWEPRS